MTQYLKTVKHIGKFMILLFLALVIIYLKDLSEIYQSNIIKNLLYLIPPILASVLGVYAGMMYGLKNPHGRALLFISSGIFAWFVGEFLWFEFDIVLGIDPFPSLADIFYLLGYPLMFVGLIMEIRHYKTQLSQATQFFFYISNLLLVIAVFYFGIILAYDPEATFFENLVAVSYGIADLVLIYSCLQVIGLVIDFRGGKLSKSWLYFLIGMAVTLIADILFAIFRLPYEEGIGIAKMMDLLWAVGYLLMGWGLFSQANLIRSIQEKVRK